MLSPTTTGEGVHRKLLPGGTAAGNRFDRREEKSMDAAKRFTMDIGTRDMGRSICDVHKRGIRSRVLDALFGRENRVLIIMPSGCVDSVSFHPVEAPAEEDTDGS